MIRSAKPPRAAAGETGRDRIEPRTATVSTDIGWLEKSHRWPALAAIGRVVRVRETVAKPPPRTAYYLLSQALSPERLNSVVRRHWRSKTPTGGSMW